MHGIVLCFSLLCLLVKKQAVEIGTVLGTVSSDSMWGVVFIC